MERLGTIYGGWVLPKKASLNENSIVYSGGVGEDISFDLKLNDKYKSKIFLIDPTKRAYTHFTEICNFYERHSPDDFKFTADIQKDYYKNISNLNPNLKHFEYIDIGLYKQKDTLKFYKQTNKTYVSQSIVENMFGDEYDIINVDSIKGIMKKLNHSHIDLLKLDIEGAEIEVLNQMLNDNIFPKYLCVEFDLLLKGKDNGSNTKILIERLMNFYKILDNSNFNITFELNC